MTKSSRKTSLKSIGKGIISNSKKALPVVDKSLKRVGVAAKDVAIKSAPIVENGVSVVYGTMAKGFDFGVQGARSVAKGISKKTRSKKGRRTRRR